MYLVRKEGSINLSVNGFTKQTVAKSRHQVWLGRKRLIVMTTTITLNTPQASSWLSCTQLLNDFYFPLRGEETSSEKGKLGQWMVRPISLASASPLLTPHSPLKTQESKGAPTRQAAPKRDVPLYTHAAHSPARGKSIGSRQKGFMGKVGFDPF